ncbi:MAG TPA: thrombospondin type 3 repeat-containing protein, partial [Verrucomicrobiae bacterium]
MKATETANPRRRHSFRPALAAVAALVLLGVVGASAQMVDLNGNGTSDIWEWAYSATNISPNVDTDGDGLLNFQEATAGTNPFDSNSYPHIPIVLDSPTNLSVTMPCAPGKQYQLQSITNFGNPNWVVETNLEARSGTNVTFTVPTT